MIIIVYLLYFVKPFFAQAVECNSSPFKKFPMLTELHQPNHLWETPQEANLLPPALCKAWMHPSAPVDLPQIGRVDKVTFILVWANKKDAHWRHPAYFIIRFRFNAVADKRQWSSAASMPRRKTRAKLCSRFCAENDPSHHTCRSFSASR